MWTGNIFTGASALTSLQSQRPMCIICALLALLQIRFDLNNAFYCFPCSHTNSHTHKHTHIHSVIPVHWTRDVSVVNNALTKSNYSYDADSEHTDYMYYQKTWDMKYFTRKFDITKYIQL